MTKLAYCIIESESLAELIKATDVVLKAVNVKLLSFEHCSSYVTAIIEGTLVDCTTASNKVNFGYAVKTYIIEAPHQILQDMFPLKWDINITNKPVYAAVG